MTRHRLLERRVSSLVAMGTQSANARDFPSFWNTTLSSLSLNDKDMPLALLYAAERHVSAEITSISSPGSIPPLDACVLKGTIGVEADHPIAPNTININEDSYFLHPYLRHAAKSRRATVVHLDQLPASDTALKGIKWGGYGDPCRTVVVCPIIPTTGNQVEGFLIIGLNPRRPFDDDYQQYLQVMVRLLATSLASVVLFEEEVRQRENAIAQAAQIQEQLMAEIKLEEGKFQRFAERSDVAIFIMNPAGDYTYRNQRWYDMFEMARFHTNAREAWNVIAFEEDIAHCESQFKQIVINNENVCFELRTRTLWSPPSDLNQPQTEATEHFRWILCSAYPEMGPNGELIEIVGNVIDISKQKWAEGIQKVRTDSALQSKQHLEHFIDTTSHEMRNPLSAIMQCADSIISAYAHDECHAMTTNGWSAFLESTLDAAQTIAQCCAHMRHIVDDILTISKLDSGLLDMTPVVAQPENVARHAVRMFDAEAKAAGIDISLVVDQSYRDMEIDWTSLDPTRVLQILINLLTNAIKFTRLEKTKSIRMTLAASATEPASSPGGIQFNEERLVEHDQHLEEDWKQAQDLIYLQFSVTDTGRGLSEEEKGTLFTRFSQASPRTHIHYGGSGLGLFISRRLTELQGGAIGLSSQSGKGSTFSFYIKTRRTKPNTTRNGSLPHVFPEDFKHRPQVGLARPVALRSFTTDDTRVSKTPVPAIRRSSAQSHQVSLTHMSTDPATLALSLQTHPQNVQPTEKLILEPLHVLIVEDNLVNQRVLAKQLRALNCIISVANHGQEALEFLPKTTLWNHAHPLSSSLSRKEAYHVPSTEPMPLGYDEDTPAIPLDLILMDWEMPVMNGLQAVAEIRRLEHEGLLMGRVPVIGVTANVREQQITMAVEAGMDGVVGKPFRVKELLGRMRDVVAGRGVGREGEGREDDW
jgi:signal transduction histidine kinase/CheY-like chemotaxis protein